MEAKTPLYQVHLDSGGKIVPFAGWLLPIQYAGGIAAEHIAVREAAGLFDVSHMGELMLRGKDALENVQKLMTNDLSGMYDGQVRYSPMCNEEGGIIDDLLIYKLNDEAYLLVVNASNRQKDVDWIKDRVFGECVFEDVSDSWAQLALQGPKAQDIIKKLCKEEELPVKYYSFTESMDVAGAGCLVSKTGYTGEDGYELYTAPENAVKLWQALMKAGEDYGLIACGLGARDTLRLEAGMPLYGQEMAEDITPFEAGLGFFVKLQKPEFIGKTALEAQKEPKRRRVGLELLARGIARTGDAVFLKDEKIGQVTSGTMCPYIKKAVAMALVESGSIQVGDSVSLEVRGRRIEAKCVELPFYKKGQ
ncbi:MAG: glycine cleavage system aminomethyltransferase GcvT [Clostridiales bacterium]|nr:glycine cleavage system aminomethyltransferase GcvT [Clostridiales bacterium]